MAIEVKVPDIGDFKDVPIIEVHVKEGDPSTRTTRWSRWSPTRPPWRCRRPQAGTVEKLLIKIGDKVSEGTPIVRLARRRRGHDAAALAGRAAGAEPPQQPSPVSRPPRAAAAPPLAPAPAPRPAAARRRPPASGRRHASPSVRRLARELEVDLNKIKGTGEKGRITREDVKAFLRGPAAAPAAAAPRRRHGHPRDPGPDFSKFGPIETKPLPRIKKISGPHLHRAWLNVPHVTHNDEADITEIDAYRKELDTAAKEKGFRVTLLAFLMKASVSALREFPEFNSSLAPEKDALILKKYYNIGIAVDTPDGLVVPVIKDVDRKGIHEISQEMGEISKKARDGKLGAADMQGASFTISSLGGIGGTAFTPIVNAPEVAILGVVRSKMAPVWNGTEFKPRLMLPLSLSYDHRVIDGALAARFARHLCTALEDVRRLIL